MSYYFTCRSELYEFVGAAAVQALQEHLKGADAVEAVAARWFEFATARPRHYQLAFDLSYVAMPRIAFQREGLINTIMYSLRLQQEVARGVIAILHGATSLPPNDDPIRWTVAQLEAYLTAFRCRDSGAWSPSPLPPC